jgi:hypothetical protein
MSGLLRVSPTPFARLYHELDGFGGDSLRGMELYVRLHPWVPPRSIREEGAVMPMRGGSNRVQLETACVPNVPQRDLDKALVQTVWARVHSAYRVAFAQGDIAKGKMLAGIRDMVRNCGRDLQNPFRVLTPRKRAALIRCCLPKDRPRFERPGAPPIPDVLKNLPKKPPKRRDPDEDDGT